MFYTDKCAARYSMENMMQSLMKLIVKMQWMQAGNYHVL